MDKPAAYGARHYTPVLVPKLEEAARFLVLAVLGICYSLIRPLFLGWSLGLSRCLIGPRGLRG